MEDKFIKYYEAIGIKTNAEKNKILELFTVAHKIANQKIIDTFVEDIRGADSKKIRNNLLFLTSNYMVMIENYMTETEFILLPYKFSITSLVVKYENYDYNKANNRSSMRIEFHSGSWDNAAFFTALGNNCDYLRVINQKYFVPNLRLGESPPKL